MMAADSDGGDDAKYQLDARERAYLNGVASPTDHAVDRHRQRAPDTARDIDHALRHAIRDPTLVTHPYWSARSDPPDSLALYRGRTPDGEVFTMVYPLDGDTAITAYRAQDMAEHVADAGYGVDGLTERVGHALRAYIDIYAAEGGVVDE